MTYKKSGDKENHFPESIPACEFVNGKFYVPPEWEDYYVRVWKWKQTRKIMIEAYKAKYLAEYETRHGEVTHWQDHKGNLRPIFLHG